MRVRGTDENTVINEDRVLDLYIVIIMSRVRGTDENTVNEWGFIEFLMFNEYSSFHQCGFEVLMKILSSMRIRGLDLYIVINAGSRSWWKYCHQWGFEFLIYTLSSMRVRGPDENTVINEDSSSWFIHCNQCGFEALMKILDLYIVINDENTDQWGFEFLIYTL